MGYDTQFIPYIGLHKNLMLFFTGIDYKVLGMLIKRHKCNFISNNVLSACVNIYLKVLGRTTGY